MFERKIWSIIGTEDFLRFRYYKRWIKSDRNKPLAYRLSERVRDCCCHDDPSSGPDSHHEERDEPADEETGGMG